MDHYPPHMEQVIAAPRKKPTHLQRFAIGDMFRLDSPTTLMIEETQFTIYPGLWYSSVKEIQGIEHIVVERLK
jgi:hypothetical protein